MNLTPVTITILTDNEVYMNRGLHLSHPSTLVSGVQDISLKVLHETLRVTHQHAWIRRMSRPYDGTTRPKDVST